MRWLRVLIPSWRFFDKPNPVCTLHYRVDGHTTWHPFTFPTVPGFLLNPRGNLNLAFQAIVDAGDTELAQRLVHHLAPAGRRVHFKLCVDGEEALLS